MKEITGARKIYYSFHTLLEQSEGSATFLYQGLSIENSLYVEEIVRQTEREFAKKNKTINIEILVRPYNISPPGQVSLT